MHTLVHALRTTVRRFLGTDALPRMETTMASAAEQITAVKNQVADLISDVQAQTQILTQKSGQLDAEGQAALDELAGLVAGFDAEVGDADGSDTVTEPIEADPNQDASFR